jgi:hypothetical protein
MEQELKEAIERAIAAKRHESITASSIADAVVRELLKKGEVGSYGSREHITHVAGEVLQATFDPCRYLDFSGNLLDRYPAAQKINGETVYVRKEAMTDEDLAHNVRRLEAAAAAFQDMANRKKKEGTTTSGDW